MYLGYQVIIYTRFIVVLYSFGTLNVVVSMNERMNA